MRIEEHARASTVVGVIAILAGCYGRVEPGASTLDAVPLAAGAEDAGVAAADASSEAAPLPRADGGVMACACASAVVSCKGGVGYASADRRACALTLSPSTCETLGLSEGVKVLPQDILAAEPQAPATPGALYDLCASKHEARHLCDGPDARPCATEQNAYLVSLACFEAFEDARCRVGVEDPLCQWLSRYLGAHRAAYRFNACLCTASSTCAACLKSCTAVERGDVLPMCTDAAKDYCPVNGK